MHTFSIFYLDAWTTALIKCEGSNVDSAKLHGDPTKSMIRESLCRVKGLRYTAIQNCMFAWQKRVQSIVVFWCAVRWFTFDRIQFGSGLV